MGFLRKRILLLLCSISAVLVLAIAGWYWEEQYQLEMAFKEATQRNSELVDKIIDLRGDRQEVFACDYSYWDEMVEFANNPDPEWAKNNLYEGLITYGADAIAVYNIKGTPVYFANAQDQQIKKLDITQNEIKNLFIKGPLCHFFKNTPYGLLEIRGAKITFTEDFGRKGTAQGYWFVVNVWDSRYLKGLGELLGAKTTLESLNSEPHSRNGREVYRFMVFERPLLASNGMLLKTLRITKEYRVAILQQSAARRTLLLIIVFTVVILLVLFIVLTRLVTEPVRLLSEAVETESAELLTGLERKETEFGQLATLIRKFFQQKTELEIQTSEHIHMAEELQKSEEHLQATLRSIGDGVISTDAKGNVTSLNTVAEKLTGWASSEARGKSIDEVFHIINSKTLTKAKNPVRQALKEGKTVKLENHTALVARDGTVRQIADSCAPIHDDKGGILGIVLVFRDITEEYSRREELRASEERFSQIAEQSGELIWEVDAQGLITYASHACEMLLGYTEDEIAGKLHFYDLHPRDGHEESRRQRIFEKFAHKEHIKDVESRLVAKDGRIIDIITNGSPILDADGSLRGYRGSSRDITERKKAEVELIKAKYEVETLNAQLQAALLRSQEYAAQVKIEKEEAVERARVLDLQSNNDTLTKLYNRNYFEKCVREKIEGTRSGKSQLFAVLFMDLDHFKLINDTMGHDVGDLLLVELASRLRSCVRSGDVLARMGGDEFTALLTGYHDRSSIESVALRILDSITRPFSILNYRFVVGISIGISTFPEDGIDVATVIKNADAAMYRAKQEGKGTFRWYTGDIDSESKARMLLGSDLMSAVDKDQLFVHYQPILNLNDRSLHGAEALLRWEHPEKGMIAPSIFIPLAESTGLIKPIGKYILRTSCAQMKAWLDEGIALEQIGVNISAWQIRDRDWIESIQEALAETGLSPKHLNIEITETVFSSIHDDMTAMLKHVRDLGVTVTIDDFGMGESSLKRLRDLPMVPLKIDGSFIRDIEHNDSDKALLESTIRMAHDHGIRVTAEWVETEAQIDILRTSGCDYAQGYAISPPIPPDQFRSFALEQIQSKSDKRQAA